MSRRAPTASTSMKRGRRKTLIWIVCMAAIVIALLYWEKVALLYVLATLGLTVLMVIVAMADLGGSKKLAAEPAVPADDAAAIGAGINSAVPSSSAPSATRRR